MNQLKKRLRNGEPAAFTELYDLFGEKLFRYVCSLTDSTEDAGDVVQEIFVRLVKSQRRLGKADNLTGYLFKVARNESFRWLNRNRKYRNQEPLHETEANGDFNHTLDDREWTQFMLRRLDAIDRELVQLKIYSGLTFNEISLAVDMPAGTVATRYRRAIQKLSVYADASASSRLQVQFEAQDSE